MTDVIHDSWLESDPPWAQTSSLPFVPHKTDSALEACSTSDGRVAVPSNLTLLSKLLEKCAAVDLPALDFPPEEFYGIALGDGTTYKVEKKKLWQANRRTWRWVAAKRAKFMVPKIEGEMRVVDRAERNRLRAVLLEIEILCHPPLKGHPNVAALLGYSWDEVALGYAPVLVMEIADFGSLQRLLSSEKLDESERQRLCLDIACGLEILHQCMIVHGDVKLENVLVFPHPERRFVAKLTDFEHSLLDGDSPRYQGTPVYNAPEVFLLNQPSIVPNGRLDPIIPTAKLPMCDVFSYGLLVFETLCNGKRYYEFEESRELQLPLTTESGNQDTLQTSLDLLEKTRPFGSSLLHTCAEIFRKTLCYSAADRLSGGWTAIKAILGNTDAMDKNQDHAAIPISRAAWGSTYSVLEFHEKLGRSSTVILAETLWAELEYLAKNAETREQRGKASFELCILYALGSCSLPLEAYEVMNWMASAALLGYHSSFIVGKRIYQANGLPVPKVFSDLPHLQGLRDRILDLEHLPASEFYCNAVRLFWTEALRTSLIERLRPYEVARTAHLETWIENELKRLGDPDFSVMADTQFLVHQAVSLPDLNSVVLLIDHGCNINLQLSDGRTPLILACSIGNAPVIRLLLSFGADASINDADRVSPLHWLIMLSNDDVGEIASALVGNGANINAVMTKDTVRCYDGLGLVLGVTPLWWACLCQNGAAVEILISLGADTYNLYNKLQERVPVEVAIGVLASGILEILLTRTNTLDVMPSERKEDLYNLVGSSVSSNNFQRWCMHAGDYEEKHSEIMDVLARHKIPFPIRSRANLQPGVKPYSPLTNAAMRFNVPLAKAIIRRGADINDHDYDYGHTALFTTLLSSAAGLASPKKMLSMLNFLIKNGASLEPEQMPRGHNKRFAIQPPLHLACQTSCSAAMIQLIAAHAPTQINSKAKSDDTPLHCIAKSGIDHENEKAFRALLDLGADPNIETNHMHRRFDCCYTATAHVICNDDRWQLSRYLLDQRVSTSVGLGGGHHQTLAHVLVFEAFTVHSDQRAGGDQRIALILESLLEHPVALERDLLNVTDSHGATPLVLAILYGLPHIARVLLKLKARTDVTFNGGSLSQLVEYYHQFPPTFVVEDADYNDKTRKDVSIRQQTFNQYRSDLLQIAMLLSFEIQHHGTLSEVCD